MPRVEFLLHREKYTKPNPAGRWTQKNLHIWRTPITLQFLLYPIHFGMGSLASTTTLSLGFFSKLSFPSSFHRLRFSSSRSFLSIFRNPSLRAKRSSSMATHLQVNASSTLGACSVFSLLFLNCVSVRGYVLCDVSYHLYGCLVAEKLSGR